MDNLTEPQWAGSSHAEAPAPFALLDYLVPGFSVFSKALEAYLGINLNLYIPMLLVIFGATFSWDYISEYAWNLVERHLMSSVSIRPDDEIYNYTMAWVARQSFAQRSRRFIVNTNINSRAWHLWRSFDEEEEEEVDHEATANPNRSKKTLQYTPSFGTHYFWFERQFLLFERQENREQNSFLTSSEREELSIKCFGRNPAIIKRLLLHARDQYLAKDDKKTLIFRGASSGAGGDPIWQRCMTRSSRPFSTVILNEKVKKDLISDVEDYLNPSTRRWYANRGIPYRRGYLLHGPPGTGKSSLSLALAGFFQMRIYIVSLSSVIANEESLSTLFNELPRRCVVLLEDIDSAGLTHTREDKDNATQLEVAALPPPPPPTSPSKSPTAPQTPPGRLSLSGLLNILDGVASQEGRVLIMTTNHIEKLDKALIRPGRVDMIVKFGLADAGMSAAIFRAIYAPYEGESASGDGTVDSKKVVQLTEDHEQARERESEERQKVTEHIEALSKSFAAKVPEHEFSPAEIQGLLLRHKRDPEGVIDHVDDWAVQTRQDKKQKEVEDAENKRKEEAKRLKEEAKQKRKEAKAKAKKKKLRAEKKKNGEDCNSSDSDSDLSNNEGDSEGGVSTKSSVTTVEAAEENKITEKDESVPPSTNKSEEKGDTKDKDEKVAADTGREG